jgi:hypothetical protein
MMRRRFVLAALAVCSCTFDYGKLNGTATPGDGGTDLASDSLDGSLTATDGHAAVFDSSVRATDGSGGSGGGDGPIMVAPDSRSAVLDVPLGGDGPDGPTTTGPDTATDTGSGSPDAGPKDGGGGGLDVPSGADSSDSRTPSGDAGGAGGAGGMGGAGGAGSDASVATGCVRFVSASAPEGGDGLSWSTAFRIVSVAVQSATRVSPCEVWVTGGTYYTYVSAATDTVRLAAGVSLFGGFTGVESTRDARDWRRNVTTLSGYSAPGGSRVYHVVVGPAGTLDGFTITGGNANVAPNDRGGGIFAETGSPIVRNCVVSGNDAVAAGGGAFFGTGSALVEDTVFSNNHAGSTGGGFHMEGSGIISRATINNNKSDNDSGGGSVDKAAPTIQDSVFYSNTAADYSGGLGILPDSTGARVLNNTFYANVAPHGGGGVSVNTSAATVVNNIALNNTGKYGPNILVFDGRTPVVHHNCGNSGIDGTNVIDGDPGLVAPASGDFHLLSTSPCIDQADDGLAPPQDMSGGGRIDIPNVGVSIADMGALEYRP